MNLMIRDFGKNSEKKIFVYYIDFTILNTIYNRHNTKSVRYIWNFFCIEGNIKHTINAYHCWYTWIISLLIRCHIRNVAYHVPSHSLNSKNVMHKSICSALHDHVQYSYFEVIELRSSDIYESILMTFQLI